MVDAHCQIAQRGLQYTMSPMLHTGRHSRNELNQARATTATTHTHTHTRIQIDEHSIAPGSQSDSPPLCGHRHTILRGWALVCKHGHRSGHNAPQKTGKVAFYGTSMSPSFVGHRHTTLRDSAPNHNATAMARAPRHYRKQLELHSIANRNPHRFGSICKRFYEILQ